MKTHKQSLLEQFHNAQGSRYEDPYVIDFANWILERQETSKKYLDFLRHLDIPFELPIVAEVGKSEFDTIVKPYQTTIITPHIKPSKEITEERLVQGTLEVQEGIPIILRNKPNGIILPSKEDIILYMTQNPYSETRIDSWYQLHNQKSGSIIVGVYGSIYDKDIAQKIKQLKDLKSRLTGETIEEYELSKNEYFYVVGTSLKNKKLEKILTK